MEQSPTAAESWLHVPVSLAMKEPVINDQKSKIFP